MVPSRVSQLVVLDGDTLNPGDLDWQPLSAFAQQVTIYNSTAPQQVFERARHAELLLTNKTCLDAAMLAKLPSLQYIGVLATGTNVVDLAAATAQGICVTNVPAYGPDAVAQMVFAHILHHSQQVAAHERLSAKATGKLSMRLVLHLTP